MIYLEIVLGSVFGLALFLTATYYVLTWWLNRRRDTILSTNFHISQERFEVRFKSPLKPKKMIQNVNLRIEGFSGDYPTREIRGIKLTDGTIAAPEIELYDEFGNSFPFRRNGFVRKQFTDVVFDPGKNDDSFNHLPFDRNYTKLRIRSYVPFICSEIYWRDRNLK